MEARPLEPPATEEPTPEAHELPERFDRLSPSSTQREAAPVRRFAARTSLSVRIGALALFLALGCGTAVWVTTSSSANSTQPSIRIFQLATNGGEQSRPAFSPDGKRLAFAWAKGDGSNQHIYVETLGGESLFELTDLPDSEYSPAWSPDGKWIAFLSSSDAGLGLYVASLSDPHSARKVYVPGENKNWTDGALSWSPDGKSFVLVDHVGTLASSSIYLIDVDTLLARPLTTPPPGGDGDIAPVFSPDGKMIAFLREAESWNMDLCWVSTAGGAVHEVTHDNAMIDGIAWSSDNRSLVFSSNRAGQFALWKSSLTGGTPTRLAVGTEDATQPAISLNGNDLAFVQGFEISGIQHSFVSGDSHATKESTVISSSAQDSGPSISPDGRSFAFQSWRSGSRQIWVSSIDGQTIRQLTQADKTVSGAGSPSWSPNGDRILFDARIDGHAHIFAISAAGGSATQITFGNVNDIIPRWSSDGRSIYFRSNRGGRWRLWKQSMAGGTPRLMTSDDGIVGQESPDGKWLYFARYDEDGIWRMPATGGDAIRLLDQPMAGYWGYWEVTRSGVYFLDQRQATPTIFVYNPVTKRTARFARVNQQPLPCFGLSIVHDRRDFLIGSKSEANSHILIAQGVF